MPRNKSGSTNGGIIGKTNKSSFGKCTVTTFTSSCSCGTTFQPGTRIVQALIAAGGAGGGKGDGGGGSSAIVARPSSSIVPKPDESSAIVKVPKAKRTYVRLGMEGHLINIRDNVTAIDDYLKGTIAAQKKEIEDKKKQGSEQRRSKQEQKLEKPKKN